MVLLLPPLVLAAFACGAQVAGAQVTGTISKSTEGLTGLKVFGAGVPYGGSDGRGGYDKVWDGDVDTFFDCEKDCVDTGVEFAAPTAVAALRFYPRGDCYRCCKDPADTKGACRMVGGSFDGSTAGPTGPWTNIHTITEKPDEEAWTTVDIPTAQQQAFRWFRYTGNAQKNCNVAEVQVFSPGMGTPGGLGLPASVLLLTIGTYLVVGVGVNWRQGKGGPELLPHLTFWTEVRGLVADGVAFSRAGGRSNSGRRAEPSRTEPLLSSPSGRDSDQKKSGGSRKHRAKREKERKKEQKKDSMTEQTTEQAGPAPNPPPPEREWKPTPRSHLATGARETGVKVAL